MDNKFRMSATPLSKNCHTIYSDKEALHDTDDYFWWWLYVDDLRILTAMELYLNSEFYSKQPSFILLVSKHSKFSSSIDTILAISVSHNALDSNKINGELVQNETINICTSLNGLGFYVFLVLDQFVQVQFNIITGTLGQHESTN